MMESVAIARGVVLPNTVLSTLSSLLFKTEFIKVNKAHLELNT